MTAFITKPVMPEDFYPAICGALECAQSPLTKAEMTVLKKSTRFSAWPRTAHNE
jgi:23S rRNA A1618 N6-methylase RlmF